MARIISAVAIANGEVAFLGWRLDEPRVAGLLGFHIVREHLDDQDAVVEERPLASYVAFDGQSNPGWLPQNTTVWPVQKFTWRDLSLRQPRDGSARRPDGQRVRYRIAGVGRWHQGLTRVDVVAEPGSSYDGSPIPLGYLTEVVHTNTVVATASAPPFTATFTNGILSTQFLLHALHASPPTPASPDATFPPGVLRQKLQTPGDPLREKLSGDVLPLIRKFFDRRGGRFRAALYELDDQELLALLVANAGRVDLILSDAGSSTTKDVTTYDTRNAPARAELEALAKLPGATFTLQNRMFNGSGHIGHNKFVVHLDARGRADAVLTGSTNWTWSGVAGQSNNCIRIDDPVVAAAYSDYWERLHADALPVPDPPGAPAPKANQSDAVKTADQSAATTARADGSRVETWFSPNMPGRQQPRGPRPEPPPDLQRLFALMCKAEHAILFLVFLPSRGGANSIVSQAVDLGEKNAGLDVIGAISDSTAMWGATPAGVSRTGAKVPAWSPHVYRHLGVSVVRATALTDKEIGRRIGDFQLGEQLAAEQAIIHDKILVLDPLSADNCVVAFGSHNLGYKASYSNDENLTIVQGNRALAESYASHVLDVYDHYRFRAAEAAAATPRERGKRGKPWDGFLSTSDTWQRRSSHRLADYLTSREP